MYVVVLPVRVYIDASVRAHSAVCVLTALIEASWHGETKTMDLLMELGAIAN